MSNQTRVICDLPNASDCINGVKFTPLADGGMISDLISKDVAKKFLSINGYSEYESDDGEDDAPPAPPVPEAPKAPATRPPTKAQKAAEAKAAEEAQKAAEVEQADENASETKEDEVF